VCDRSLACSRDVAVTLYVRFIHLFDIYRALSRFRASRNNAGKKAGIFESASSTTEKNRTCTQYLSAPALDRILTYENIAGPNRESTRCYFTRVFPTKACAFKFRNPVLLSLQILDDVDLLRQVGSRCRTWKSVLLGEERNEKKRRTSRTRDRSLQKSDELRTAKMTEGLESSFRKLRNEEGLPCGRVECSGYAEGPSSVVAGDGVSSFCEDVEFIDRGSVSFPFPALPYSECILIVSTSELRESFQ